MDGSGGTQDQTGPKEKTLVNDKVEQSMKKRSRGCCSGVGQGPRQEGRDQS
jgi:hypothetical protein